MNSIGPYNSRSHRGLEGLYVGGAGGRRVGPFGAGDDIFTTRGVTAPTPLMGGGARARGPLLPASNGGGYRDNHVSGNSVNMYRGRSGGAVPALKRGYGDNYMSGGPNSYGGRLEADEFNFGQHCRAYDSLDDMGLDYPQISGRIRSAPSAMPMMPSSRRVFPQPTRQFEGAGGGMFGDQYGGNGGMEDSYYSYDPRDYYDGAEFGSGGRALGGGYGQGFGGGGQSLGGGGFMPESHALKQRRLDQDEGVFGYLGIHNAKKGKSNLYIIGYINSLLRTRLNYLGGSIIHSARLNENTIEALFPSRDVLRAVVEKLSPITMKGDITVYVTYKPPVPTKNNPNMKPAVRRFPQPGGGQFPQAPGGRYPQAAAAVQRQGASVLFRGAMKYPGAVVAGKRPTALMQPGLAKLGAAGAAAKTRPGQTVHKLARMRGVFPDGVQPKSLVLVADDCRPFLSLTQLATTSGQQVLTGSSLDMGGFLQVIHNDSNMSNDGVLYVIIPSLAFFFKNLDALSVLEEEVEALRAAIAASLINDEGDDATEKDDAEATDASSSTAVADPTDKKDSAEPKVSTAALASRSGKKESLNAKKPSRKRQLPLLKEVLNDFSLMVGSLDQDFLSRPPLPTASMPKVEEVEGLGQLPKLFARHLIHSSLQLRASVRASTDNCEVVFCGFPTHHMDGARATALMAKKMPEPRAQALMLAMLSALRTYNEFAVNTWMLGGFKINSFNEANLPSSFLNVENNQRVKDAAKQKDNKKADKKKSPPAEVKLIQTTTAESVAEEAAESYGRHDDSAMEVDDSSSPTDSQSAGVLPLSFLAKCGWFAEDVDKASVMAGCTANVIKAVQKVANFQLHKGGFVPWGPIEAAEFDASIVPDIVKLSVENGIYTTSLAEDSDEQTLYHCTKCLMKVGDVKAADAHAYTRRHFNAARRLVQRNAKEGGPKKSVLIGTANPTVAVPLSEDYMSKMMKFRIISLIENKSSAANSTPRYQCMVCDINNGNNFDNTSLRFHVHHNRHRLSVNNVFGLTNHRALVYQHENWPLVQSLLRHPPMDVVLLSDCRHANLLQRITKHSDRIHLLLVPDLFADTEASGMAALSEGLQMVQGRPALWLIVAGSDLFSSCPDLELKQNRENVDQLSSQIISMQVLLRIHLPPSQRVVIAPLLPLHILSETFTPLCTNNRIMDKLSSSLHCHVAQKPKVVELSKLYTSLHYRVMQLHKATSIHSNIRPIQSCVLKTSLFSKTIDVEALPFMVTTPWQIAIQTMAVGATYAAPAVFLRPYEQAEPNVEDLELDSKIQHVVVVGEEPLCKNGPRSTIYRTIEHKLSYVSEDIDFLGSKAKMCEVGEYVAWYLPCPFPEVLFDKTDMDCCAAGDCPTVLQRWTYKGDAAVKDALIKIYRFIIELQCRMPTGNFITLLPIFPSTMVTCGATSDDASHASMHALVQEQPSNIFLTRDSPDDIASAVEDLGQGWLDLFLKTNHHYALRFEKDLFVRLELMELSHAVKNLPEVNKIWAVQWKDIFNSILRNYARQTVELSDPICTRLGIELSSEHNTSSAQVNKTSAAPQTTATPATVNGDAAAASITVKKEAALSQLAESAAILSSD